MPLDNSRSNRLTPEQHDAVVREVASGATMKEVAERYGVSRQAISQLCKQARVIPTRGRPPKSVDAGSLAARVRADMAALVGLGYRAEMPSGALVSPDDLRFVRAI